MNLAKRGKVKFINLAKLTKEEMQTIIDHKLSCYLRFEARKTAATLLKTKTYARDKGYA